MHAETSTINSQVPLTQVVVVGEDDDGNEVVVDDDDVDYDEANDCGNEIQRKDTTNYLDESRTHLKQTINTEWSHNVHGVQPAKKDIGTDDQSKVKIINAVIPAR